MSTPPWLMVPQSGSNSCLAQTIATAGEDGVAFAVRPTSSSETVSPTKTNQWQETLTVKGVNIGSSSSVNVGSGSLFFSGTNLGISVKAKQNFTIAMHVITGSSAKTGATLIPYDAPSDSALQTYLNNVFGAQTNTFFTVTSDSKTVDYDTSAQNGKLDLGSGNNTSLEENAVLRATYDGSKDYNIYYVHDMNYSGGDAIGLAKWNLKVAYLRDTYSNGINASPLQTIAHELGHLCGIRQHADDQTYNGVKNPTYVPPHSSTDFTDRLMYHLAAGGMLLIKPEWDLINSKTPNQ